MDLNYQFPVAIDNTMRTAFDACQRKFLLAHIYNLRSGDPSIHLVFGAAYAKGLEVARKEFYTGNKDKASYVGKAMIAAIQEWHEANDDPMLDESKSLLNCLCAIDYYFEEFPMENDWVQPLMIDDEPAVEFTFAMPLELKGPDGNPVLYAGRFDMFIDFQGNAAVYDDKTTSQLGQSWINGWNLDSQMTSYIWAGQQHGFNTTTAVIRGVSILKTKFGNAQAIEHRTDFEVRSWYNLVHHNLYDMIEAFDKGEDHFLPSYGQACKAFGGCPYAELCKKENWKDWIEPDFHEYVWNPLAIAGVKGEKETD